MRRGAEASRRFSFRLRCSACAAEYDPNQLINLCRKCNAPLLVEYDPGLFAVRTEEIRIDDERLAASWGDALHRTVLDVRRPPAAGSWTLRAGPGQVIG